MKTLIITLPSIWASYLINCDASGLDDVDQKQCDEYVDSLLKNGIGSPCDVSEQTYFGQFAGIGHDLADYTFVIVDEVKYSKYLHNL